MSNRRERENRAAEGAEEGGGLRKVDENCAAEGGGGCAEIA